MDTDASARAEAAAGIEQPMITIKSNFSGDIRRFAIPQAASLADLMSKLDTIYNISDEFTVAWQDEENDFVSISTDAEWRYACQNVDGHMLRLKVTKGASSTPSAQGSSSTEPILEELPPSPVHNASCDCCGRQITGIRFVTRDLLRF